MQGLTVWPRDNLTEDEVTSILTSDRIEVSAGLELVDGSNVFIEDITDDLVAGEVNRDNYAEVHGGCALKLTRQLAWGRARVKPYMILATPSLAARFNLGVYVLTSPVTPHGQDPVTYDVHGYDLLYLLSTTGPGDTYVVNSGVTYASAIQSVLSSAGTGVLVLLDGTRQTTTLPSPMVWVMTDSDTASWLRIVNDMLAAIGYRGLWADQEGRLRSGPYAPPWARAVEWELNTADLSTNLVGEEREMSADVWGIPNWWKFVMSNMATAPVEGTGMYTVTNQADGPTSIDVLGRVVRKVVFMDVADQAALESEGDRIVYEDRQVARTYKIKVDPLPIAGHFDVVQFIDGNVNDTCQVVSWVLPLDGSQGDWLLEVAS